MEQPIAPRIADGKRRTTAPYRMRQFFGGLTARLSPEEFTLVTRILPPAAVELFARMAVDVQRHSLNVLVALQDANIDQPDLAGAALLHDVGKAAAGESGIHLGLWWRGPLVLAEAFAPRLLQRLASADARHGWRYLVYVHLMHPRIGADWARQAGCTPLTCWLIEHHQDASPGGAKLEERRLLAALQWADNRN